MRSANFLTRTAWQSVTHWQKRGCQVSANSLLKVSKCKMNYLRINRKLRFPINCFNFLLLCVFYCFISIFAIYKANFKDKAPGKNLLALSVLHRINICS